MSKKTTLKKNLCDICLSIASSENLKELLNSFVKQFTEYFELKGAVIRLMDKKWKTLEIAAHYGLSEEYINKGPVNIENNDIDQEVTQGKTVIIRNAAKEPRIQYPQMVKQEGIRSLICIPIKYKSHFMGILRGYFRDLHNFEDDEIEKMEKLANQCAISIENQINADRNRVLLEFTRKVNSNLDLGDTLKTLVQLATEAMNAKACTIRLLDEQSQKMITKAVWGLSDTFLKKGPHHLDKLQIDQLVLKGEMVYIQDVTKDPRFMYPEEAAREGIVSALAVPLQVMEKVLGTMRIYTAHEYEFSESEKNFLFMLANEGATALNNAMLYNRLHTLFEVTSSLTKSLEMNQIFKTIVEGATNAMNAQGAALLTLDCESNQFEIQECYGVSKEFLKTIKNDYIDSSKDIARGEQLIKRDLDSELRKKCLAAADKEGIHSFINVPMKAKEHLTGIIQLYFTSSRDCTNDEIEFIISLANEAAVAIENARLYDALNKKYNHLVEDIFLWYDGSSRGMDY